MLYLPLPQLIYPEIPRFSYLQIAIEGTALLSSRIFHSNLLFGSEGPGNGQQSTALSCKHFHPAQIYLFNVYYLFIYLFYVSPSGCSGNLSYISFSLSEYGRKWFNCFLTGLREITLPCTLNEDTSAANNADHAVKWNHTDMPFVTGFPSSYTYTLNLCSHCFPENAFTLFHFQCQ